MRTWIEVVARAGPGGRTVLPVVRAGGQLGVRSVAAALALPDRDRARPSVQRIVATVAGTLDLGLEPTVVAAGTHHVADLRVDVGEGAG